MLTSRKRLVLIAVASLLVLELVTRFLLIPRSGDLVRLDGYSRQADSLQRCGGVSVALVGNSTAEMGIDTESLLNDLRALGVPEPCLAAFLADGSGMTTWRAMLRHYFWSRGKRADVVVLVGSGPDFHDEGSPDAGRLGRYLTSGGEWRALLTTDSLPLHTRADALLSSLSATFAARRKLMRRLQAYLPSPRGGPGGNPARPASHALAEVLAKARADGTNVLIVLFPVREEASPDPEIVERIAAGGAQLLDLREGTGLQAGDYADKYHLRPPGRTTLTRQLAAPLAHSMQAAPAGTQGP